MRFSTVDEWLTWQETLHPAEIDLTLERVKAVYERLGLCRPARQTISVAGTNGKGSCVAMLDSVLRQAGYRVGTYTSPHLLRYNERIRVNGMEVDDASLCAAFERVDQARGDISLTYFEFGTLAALSILQQADLDVAILEVGLGGRLDAVNVVDTGIALITTIDLDHSDWLGPDRESIAREKAGIIRGARPVVCGDRQVPDSLISVAVAFNAPLYMLGHDFEYKQVDGTWNWKGVLTRRAGLPAPGLMGRFQLDNAAAVLMVLELLREQIPVSQADVRLGLSRVRLPGRFQVFEGPVLTILDVAHNPQAARELAGQLRTTPCSGQTHGLCAMLKDKDHAAVMASLADTVDHWHLCGLDIARGATALELAAVISQLDVSGSIEVHDTIQHGFDAMGSAARSGDRLVVFGSFYTVAAVLKMGIAPN